MAKTLVIEVGTEEIPSSYILPALVQLEHLVKDTLNSNRIGFAKLRTFGTPRRLVIYSEGVEEMQKDSSLTVSGPPRSGAYDREGNPTKAAIGFAKSQGVPVESLTIRKTEKGEYIFAEVLAKGKPTKEILASIVPGLFTSLSFPKLMRWKGKFLFPRPIRWTLALLGNEVVEFELAGVKSGRLTTGHRFLSPQWTEVGDASDYFTTLREKYVVLDQEERKRILEEEIAVCAQNAGGIPIWDDELEGIVSFLVEYPKTVLGSFEPSFLKLPREVVVTAMREHQRYFAVEDRARKLLPFFVAVTNGANNEEVKEGNERVLKARLDDARFYWEKDTREKMEKRVSLLKNVVWQEGLGSFYEKAQRLVKLCGRLAALWEPKAGENAERAALLSKVDLISEMVRDGKEFTSLEGVIGGRYAEFWGEKPPVCQAIAEQYLPRGLGDKVPESIEGTMLSVADKSDTITGSFILGKIPTGSEDPYGLRRNASSILRILLEKGLSLSLGNFFGFSIEAYDARIAKGKKDDVFSSLRDFFRQRMESLLKEEAFSYDIVDAVLSASFDDPRDVWERSAVLREFRKDERFEGLVVVNKRLSNILKGTESSRKRPPLPGREKKHLLSPLPPGERTKVRGIAPPKRSLFSEDAEIKLLDAAVATQKSVSDALGARDYRVLFLSLLMLEKPIHEFFENVMVMVEDKKKKNARIELLTFVRSLFLSAWDLSKIVLEGEVSNPRSV
ncbi:MAG: glycine--tRNA ligase subunit beta [Candidatus Eisenbacteria bacterium]|nr:glycine--tRNA ligase subunit beta [Candidatus Eisenbacteria bacterium]